MKFRSEKKQLIVQYILEKIAEQKEGLSRHVADTFSISTNTVHSYLKELLNDGVIEKSKRDQYHLTTQKYTYFLRRSEGHLDTDTYALDTCLMPHIGELPENIKKIWEYAFSEMTNNVMDHSHAETVLIEIQKSSPRTTAVIVDDGVGIFEKIKQHFGFATLDDAVCELFKGKLTTDSEHHSGEGIFFTSRMMDSFLITSCGKVFATTKYDDDMIADWEGREKGTGVFMSLSNQTNKTVRDIFDEYADVDGGFTQTSIPLKHIFDTAPVSRSQAKRICHRLDEFQEVTLDFEGLTWMGQGFAHQIFVVYQKAHPNIRITPINMEDGVRRMYDHVIHSA